jgi:D-amino-acid dehydrogenase
MTTISKTCIVIGAGTVGTSCAWHLNRAGFEVTLLDPEMPGQSTSFGNCGCISPNQIIPFSYPGVTRDIPRWLFDRLGPLCIRWRYMPSLAPWFWRFWRASSWDSVHHIADSQTWLMRQIIDDFAAITDASGTRDLIREKGMINVYDTVDEFNHSKWKYELMTKHGFDWEIIGPAELKIMVPELRLENGMALYYPQWWHTVDPGRLTSRIAEDAFANGVNWLQDKVRAVVPGATGVQVTTESGRDLHADKLVVAAGAWSNDIARQVDGRSVPMTPKRGYHLHFTDPGVELEYPVTSSTRFFVMTPMLGGLRIAGTAEFASLDAEPDYRRAHVLREHGKHYLPNLQVEQAEEWMGRRPMMADSLPVLGPSPRHERVLYAFGHGHYGLAQGPTTGKIIARLAQGEPPGAELHPYRFDRF